MLSNPHKNPLRNARKRLDAVTALKAKPSKSLNEEQLAKVRTEKKLHGEVKALEQKMREWEAANGGVVDILNAEIAASTAAIPAKKSSSAPSKKNEEGNTAKPVEVMPISTGDVEKDKTIRKLTKKLRGIEELKARAEAGHTLDSDQKTKLGTEKSVREMLTELEQGCSDNKKSTESTPKKEKKKAMNCEAAAPLKEKIPKKQDKPKSAAPRFFGDEESASSLMEPREEKTLRNRMKNLRNKLASIKELKRQNESDLSAELVSKLKTEKEVTKELAEIIDKLTAFGKM